MKLTKKLFALLLAVIMVLALIPAAAFAEERNNENADAPSPNGFIHVDIPGTRAVTDAYLRGDTETYNQLSGGPKRDLPSKYDSRDYNYITAVRNQNPYGSCWAHAALASVESYMIKHGVAVGNGSAATTSINLSETQHCFFNYSTSYDAEGMLTGDKTTVTASNSSNGLNIGGNGEMSAYTLMRWTGAASETVSALAYSKAQTVARSGLDSQYAYQYNVSHVQNSVWIPGTNVDAVKQAIMEYGAGNISYYEDDDYNSYICTIDTTDPSDDDHLWGNHAITVIGWDDSIAVSKFSPNTPSQPGAWICKNSWGTGYFDRGYCYISYEDTTMNTDYIYFYDAEPIDNYDHNYQYDGTCNVVCYGKGWNNSFGYYAGFANNTKVANVFTAKGNESLKAIAFCNWDEALTYTAEVYKNPTEGNPSSGTLMATETGTLTFSGYYTIPLSNPVPLSEGDTFSVVITQNVPVADENGRYVHTPYDATFNKSSVVSWCRWTHTNHGNTSYYKEPNGSWTDCPENGDYRIKAYTVDVNGHQHAFGEWASNNNGTHSRTCECGETETQNCTYNDVVTAPTATEQGYTTHTCTVCGYSFVDSYTDALGYTVTFSVPAGITAPAAMNCQAGATITLPAADAPEGYTFLGWVTETVDNVTVLPAVLSGAYAATADITLNALYSRTESTASGYALVTSAPDSWEGDYVITCGKTDALYALKGLVGTKKYESKSAGGAAAFADTGMTLEGELLTNVSNAYIFTVAAVDGKFTVRNAETGTYLASKGGYLYSYKADTANYDRWTLAVNGTVVEAANGASRTIPYLGFSANNYFMINRTANPDVCFWKAAGTNDSVIYTTVIG